MEKMKGCVDDRKTHLMNGLLQGMEFAKQLRNQILNPTNPCLPSSSSSDDNQVALNKSLLEQMLSSFDKTITIAKMLSIQIPQNPSNVIPYPNHDHTCSSESPHSLNFGSPKSVHYYNNDTSPSKSKKRKSTLPRWTKTVQVGNEEVKGLEGVLDDGYSWRKYGQKEIHGAKFPRGYYRCTYRHIKCCDATKQVQRCDEDPSTYQIMYKGKHSRGQRVHLAVKAQSKPIIPSPNQHEIYVGLSPERALKVEPENYEQTSTNYISFTSTHSQLDLISKDCMLSNGPAFGSPIALETNHHPAPASYPTRATDAHIGLTANASQTNINEVVVSDPNLVTYSPIMDDFAFPIDDELLNFDIFPYDL